MAHYALIDKNNIVTRVLVMDEEVVNSGEFGNSLNWIKTSYNTYGGQHSLGGTPLRKNYAGVGMSIDASVSIGISIDLGVGLVIVCGVPRNDPGSDTASFCEAPHPPRVLSAAR